jgi:4-amino-4-deoxy-L-arabinose transferase-like glycosyltransferase
VARPATAADTKVAFIIFAGVAALLLAVHGQRMVLTNDEGIVLESAQRMAAGGRIYVDFFGYMSPGSYWLQALVFRLLGVALWTGRLIVIVDFAVQCALVFWFAARLASWRTAAAVTLTFAGFQIADPAFLTSAHRWDSATFALAGLCMAVSAFLSGAGRWRWAASGALLAAAVWCTPSMAIVALVVSLWLAASRERRGHLFALLGGAAAIGLAGIAALMYTGSLGAFFTQMAWLRQNYAGVNVLPYGSIIGGWHGLLEGSHGILETTLRLILIACVALPAILPPAAVLLCGLAIWRSKSAQRDILTLLLPAVAALAITAFPRADVMHLAFVAALPYAIVGVALANLLPARTASWVALGAMSLAAVFASNYIRGWRDSSPVPSPAGILHVARNQAPDVQLLMQQVHPGDSLFVYPYMPVQYFLTQARNPTRYPYLQPGMMTREQGAEALSELQSRPPEWLLYLQLSREELLRVFPNGAGRDWRFAELESWMQQNYRPVEGPSVSVGGYRLWRHASVPQAAALPEAAALRP